MKQHPKPGCWRGESLTVAHHSHHDLIAFYLLQQETWTRGMNLNGSGFMICKTPCHLGF